MGNKPISTTVPQNLPSLVGQLETRLFPAIKTIANAQMLPINEIKPPIKTLFISNPPYLLHANYFELTTFSYYHPLLQIASRSNKNPVFSIHKLFFLIVPHVLLSCFSRAALMTPCFLSSAALQRLLRRRSSRRVNERVAALPETGPSTANAVAYEWTAKQRKYEHKQSFRLFRMSRPRRPGVGQLCNAALDNQQYTFGGGAKKPPFARLGSKNPAS